MGGYSRCPCTLKRLSQEPSNFVVVIFRARGWGFVGLGICELQSFTPGLILGMGLCCLGVMVFTILASRF